MQRTGGEQFRIKLSHHGGAGARRANNRCGAVLSLCQPRPRAAVDRHSRARKVRREAAWHVPSYTNLRVQAVIQQKSQTTENVKQPPSTVSPLMLSSRNPLLLS